VVRAQAAGRLEPVTVTANATNATGDLSSRRSGARSGADPAAVQAAGPVERLGRALCFARRGLHALTRQRLLQAVVAFCLALLLLHSSFAFYRAGQAGAVAARALEARQLPAARDAYEQALRLDPYTATYAADQAQVLTALGLARNDQADLARARELARRAAAAEPYNPGVRNTLSLIYLLQGYVANSVTEAEAVVQANPWDVGAYEQLARACVGGAQYYLRFGYENEARELLARALQIPGRVQAQAARLDAGGVWQGPRLAVTTALRLAQGQALYLLDRRQEAVAELQVAYKDQVLARATAPWLAAALSQTGRGGEAEAVLRLYPGARQEYEQILD
jgi:tetratricopeptide (TPR) repeat protein